MKILHTADLHLNAQSFERWDALKELADMASDNQVSVFVICGDLFDQDAAVEMLRGKLRSILGGRTFKTIILPGNHDYKAYRSGLYFGENVTVMSDPRQPLPLKDNIMLWGLPYEPLSRENLAYRLKEIGRLMDPACKNLLLFHGELLDVFYFPPEWGDEGDRRYMPVQLSFFEKMPLQYVLAGHFHSRYLARKIPGGGFFIYPGSPVSVTRREVGKRAANLFTVGEEPAEVTLNSFHFEKFNIKLDPFTVENPVDKLKQIISSLHHKAALLLEVDGLFDGEALGMNEQMMAAELNKIAESYLAAEPVFDFLDVQHVLKDELFRDFDVLLEESAYEPGIKKQAREMAIKALRVVAR